MIKPYPTEASRTGTEYKACYKNNQNLGYTIFAHVAYSRSLTISVSETAGTA